MTNKLDLLKAKRQELRVNKGGFSLMELIIVIVIIGILIAAIVSLAGQKEVAKVSAAEQVITQIGTAAQGWAVMNATEDFTNISLNELIGTTLPDNFNVNKANPWSSGIEVAVATNVTVGNPKNHFKITLKDVPAPQCEALVNKFENKVVESSENTTACGTTGSKDFVAVF